MKALLLGEAPGGDGKGGPLAGRAGNTLALLAGLTDFDALKENYELANLIDDPQDRLGKGRTFPSDVARRAATRRELPPVAVLLGKRVAAAFGVGDEHWLHFAPYRNSMVAVIPHPSGINIALNDPAVRRRTAEVLAAARLRARL